MKIDLDRLRLKLRYKIVYHLGLTCHDVDHLVDETFARVFEDHRLEHIFELSEFATLLNGVCAETIREYRSRPSAAKTMTAWN